ncbi:MAG: phage integrase N-terminal SAM-like domain-containing protein [Rhodocyclaceae bacterium]|nr:phage integrase N-terminal SAM-like domain-containing protein [Rhodocyclaceae bacterium]
MSTSQPDTLIGRVREAVRYKHYSIRTERAYVEWVRRFVRFHDMRHPRDMGAPEVRAFLGRLSNRLMGPCSIETEKFNACKFSGSRLPAGA